MRLWMAALTFAIDVPFLWRVGCATMLWPMPFGCASVCVCLSICLCNECSHDGAIERKGNISVYICVKLKIMMESSVFLHFRIAHGQPAQRTKRTRWKMYYKLKHSVWTCLCKRKYFQTRVECVTVFVFVAQCIKSNVVEVLFSVGA